MFVRIFSPCRRRIFCLFFGAFKSIPQALRASSLTAREPWVGAIFGFLPQRKQRGNLRLQHRKIRTFSFCGSAVGRYVPFSGRNVARVSVTEGARGTEKRQIFLFLHRSLFPQRLPSF